MEKKCWLLRIDYLEKSPSTLHSVNGEKPGGIMAITDKQEVGSNP